jgi:uncharacterized membrane protein HdeD (DUF308 family)
VAGRSTARLVTFLALFWITGGLITLRFALAIRPRPGFRLGLAAAIAAIVGAVLLLLRDRLSGLVDPGVLIGLLGISAVLTGLLRILGGFAAEERLGRGWTLGGIVLGTLEVALGVLLLLTSEVDPGQLAPIAAAWGAVSGTLLLAQGLRLRRFARTWQASGRRPKSVAGPLAHPVRRRRWRRVPRASPSSRGARAEPPSSISSEKPRIAPVLVLGVGGREQVVEFLDGVHDRHRNAVGVRRNRPPSPSTPPFSCAPSLPGWQ